MAVLVSRWSTRLDGSWVSHTRERGRQAVATVLLDIALTGGKCMYFFQQWDRSTIWTNMCHKVMIPRQHTLLFVTLSKHWVGCNMVLSNKICVCVDIAILKQYRTWNISSLMWRAVAVVVNPMTLKRIKYIADDIAFRKKNRSQITFKWRLNP